MCDCRELSRYSATRYRVSSPCLVLDVSVYTLNWVRSLILRFQEWARQERDPRQAESFSKSERDFLHRITTGIAWLNEQILEQWQATISVRSLARLKFDISLQSVKRAQVDLIGLREEGDWPSLLLVTHQLLWAPVDALLVGFELTNVVEKWRFRLLRRVPSDWHLQLPGVTPPGLAADFILRLLQPPPTLDSRNSLSSTLAIAVVHVCTMTSYAKGAPFRIKVR